jgi:hypothetical protein
MDRHAGFATAIGISERVFQDLVRVMYVAGKLNPHLVSTAPSLNLNLIQDVPKVFFLAGDPSRITLEISAWGPATVTPPGGNPEQRDVLFNARVVAPLMVGLNEAQLLFSLNGLSAQLTSLSIVPYRGGPFSSAAQTFIDSSSVRSLLLLGIRNYLNNVAQMIPPFSLALLDPALADSNATVQARVLQGVLVLGIDAHSAVTTTGDPNLLTNFNEGQDLAIWSNPAYAKATTFSAIEQKFKAAIEGDDAEFGPFDLDIVEGGLAISGSGSKSTGTVEFSLKAVPKLVREWDEFVFSELDEAVSGGPHKEHYVSYELWFEVQDLDLDVDRAPGVVILELLGALFTLGVGTKVIEDIINGIRASTEDRIVSGVEGDRRAITWRFSLEGIPRPMMYLHIDRYECHVEGVFIGLTYHPEFWGTAMDGPWNPIAAENALTDTIKYEVRLGAGLLVDDPELRVRWTVRRLDTNQIVFTTDDVVANSLSLELTIANVPFLETDFFQVECRVYRALGSQVTEFLNYTRALTIQDALDRSHPFVQWTHDVFTPIVEVRPDGSSIETGYQLRTRQSAIHRTALPGRCRMATSYSLKREEPNKALQKRTPDYLDELPFPIANLIPNRSKVCDYCFFGGPDKTEPLI